MAEFWLMLTDIILKNFLVCLWLSTGQGAQWMQQNLHAATLFPRLKWFTSVVSVQPTVSMPGDTSGQTEFTCKDVSPKSWWSCASRCLVNAYLFIWSPHDSTGRRSITKGHFWEMQVVPITSAFQSNFNATAFPLISVHEVVSIKAHAQNFCALFSRHSFQNWQ